MKKIILILLVSTTANILFCQQTNHIPKLTQHDYLQKSKNQKTAAWILLSSGVITSGIGFISAATKSTVETGSIIVSAIAGIPPTPHENYHTESTLLIIGTTATLLSIPLFIASSKNKKRGMSLSFKNEMSQEIQNGSFVKVSIPSLNIKIRL